MTIKYLPYTLSIAALAATLNISAPAPAKAELAVSPQTVAARIEQSGNLRMLSEGMAKYFCYARAGQDPVNAVAGLQTDMAMFDQIHLGLVDGDDSLGLFAETSPEVRKAWDNVDLMWSSARVYYDKALSGQIVDERDFDRINGLTLELDKRVNDMVTQVRAVYAKELGEGGIGEALLIDLYDRQLMLAEKIAKEVCLVRVGYKGEEEVRELNESIALFENSLNAFQEGFPIAGIPAPPTEGIKAQLAKAHDEWQKIRLTAVNIASGTAVTLTDYSDFAEGIPVFEKEMIEALHMLEKHELTN
ncbi:MAG: type IV pili methyl-accepting chemotaxis transducer N-terminal domain-containing protein [Pseudomonadota bacterium]